MSLLLKALENAAKNRETAAPGAEAGSSAEPDSGRAELRLEPIEQSAQAQGAGARGQAQPSNHTHRVPGDDDRGPSPQQAQTVLRASKKLARSSVFDWLARRPLVAFSTAAGIFAIGYGTYLYLQITNPGIFIASPIPVPRPPVSRPPPVQSPAPPHSPVAGTSEPAASKSGDQALAGASRASPTASAGGSPAPPSLLGTPATATPEESAATSMREPAAPPNPPATQPPKVAVAPAHAGTSASVRHGAGTPNAARRPLAKSRPSEGVTPNESSRILPVSATLVSAHQALEKGQLDQAERLYRQSLASDPRNIDAMLGLAATLTQQDKGDAAAQFYMRVLEQDPRNAFAQAGLLNIGGRADPAGAELRLKQLIAREPSAFLYFSLGNLYAEQGRWASAQSAYFQAHNLAPDNPDYAFNLAVGLEHVSQPRIALDYYRRALALAQSRGHAQFDAAKVQARVASIESALAAQP